METGILLIDIDRCIRCHACEVACKQENDLPPGPRWNSVVTIEPRTIQRELVTDFVFTACMQCDDPNCALHRIHSEREVQARPSSFDSDLRPVGRRGKKSEVRVQPSGCPFLSPL